MKTIFSIFLVLILVAAIIPSSSLMVNAQEDFTAQVSADQGTAPRGSEQTITVETSDPSQVFGSITYASNFTRAFVGNTNDDGVFEHTWTIGGNSKPGTFEVDVIAISEDNRAAQASTTFIVQEAGEDGVVLTPEPVDNGTVSEGNGTIIVPEEPLPINETGNVTVENQTVPSVNETIPVPVPINTTTGNETIPVPIPIDPATNETVSIPELPTNETVSVEIDETTPEEIEDEIIVVPANETVVVTPDNGTDISIPVNETSVVIPTNETANPEPSTNETEVIVAPEDDTVVVTPDNTTAEVPIQVNDTTVVVPGDIVDIAENETVTETPVVNQNQTEQLPTEIPVNSTQGNQTIPIPIPINSTTGNETIPLPPIDVNIPSNTTIPVQNETEPAVENATGSVEEILANLDERTEALENKSASQDEIFVAVGGAIQDMGDAVSIIPGLTDEESAKIVEAVNNVKDAIAEAIS